MKKIILAIAIMLASASIAKAQYINDAKTAEAVQAGAPVAFDEATWNAQHASLVSLQNHYLKSRKIGLIIAVSGSATMALSESMFQMTEGNEAFVYLALGGALATITGGIWLLDNEFKMIKTQKMINNHLNLKLSPGGVAIQF